MGKVRSTREVTRNMQSTKPTSMKRKGGMSVTKETSVKSPRLCLPNDTTLDMDELFNSVIGAAPATAPDTDQTSPPTKFYLGSLQDLVVKVNWHIVSSQAVSPLLQ